MDLSAALTARAFIIPNVRADKSAGIERTHRDIRCRSFSRIHPPFSPCAFDFGKRLVVWVVAPGGFVGRCQRFGGTYCLHLQGRSSFVALVSIYKPTRRCYPDDERRYLHRCENLRSRTAIRSADKSVYWVHGMFPWGKAVRAWARTLISI
jgi:hypothetical protein